jgi:hypothetical protein
MCQELQLKSYIGLGLADAAARPLKRAAQVPAIHGKNRPRHVSGGFRGKQQQGTVEILGLTKSALRDAVHDGFSRLCCEKLAVDISPDVAGSDGVDANSVARKLECHRARQMDESCL